MIKTVLPLGLIFGIAPLINAQSFVTIDSSNALGAFMVVHELPANGGQYVFADNWGAPTASANYSDADTLVIGPENNAYDTSGDTAFWRAGGVGPLGNKEMRASVFVGDNSIVGQDVSFDFNVDSITFTEHTTIAFIRIFDEGFNGTLAEVTKPLDSTGHYNLSLTAAQTGVTGAVNAQYGFQTVGINSSAAQAPAYGTIVISAAEPMMAETWAGFPIETDVGGNQWANTGDWLGYLLVESAPWLYSLTLDTWLYMEEPENVEAGAWAFFAK